MYEPSAAERSYYDELFQLALGGGPSRAIPLTSQLSGSAAVTFLSKSGLPRKTLRECWELAMEGKSEMHLPQFYVLMRTIALAQVDPEKVVTKADLLGSQGKLIQLPRFAGVHHAPSPTNSVTTASSAATNASVTTGPSIPNQSQSPWEITAQERAFYGQLWEQQETQGGLLGGQKAAAFLAKSRVDKHTLREIWNLSDMDKDGALTFAEFAVAMHLCICVSKRSLKLPSALPPELSRSLSMVSAITTDTSSSTIVVDEQEKQDGITPSLPQINVPPAQSVDPFQQIQEQPQQPNAVTLSPTASSATASPTHVASTTLAHTESAQTQKSGGGEEGVGEVTGVIQAVEAQVDTALQRTRSELSRVSAESERLKQRRQELLTSLEAKQKMLREETEKLQKLNAEVQALRTEVAALQDKVFDARESTLDVKQEELALKTEKVELEAKLNAQGNGNGNGNANVVVPSRQAPVLAAQPPPGRPAPTLAQEQQASKANGASQDKSVEDPWSALGSGGTENDWKSMDTQGQSDDFSQAFPLKAEQ